jgi:hypothetical protein
VGRATVDTSEERTKSVSTEKGGTSEAQSWVWVGSQASSQASSEAQATTTTQRYRKDGSLASSTVRSEVKAEKASAIEATHSTSKSEVRIVYVDREVMKEKVVTHTRVDAWSVNARLGLDLDGRAHWGVGIERVLFLGIAAGLAFDVPARAAFITASWRF